jgi:hypothetical protein
MHLLDIIHLVEKETEPTKEMSSHFHAISPNAVIRLPSLLSLSTIAGLPVIASLGRILAWMAAVRYRWRGAVPIKPTRMLCIMQALEVLMLWGRQIPTVLGRRSSILVRGRRILLVVWRTSIGVLMLNTSKWGLSRGLRAI